MRRKFSGMFEHETVRLVMDRGLAAAQASTAKAQGRKESAPDYCVASSEEPPAPKHRTRELEIRSSPERARP
jgi:hypothetical protein